SPREARKRADSVIDFAGLQEFTDLKLKNYSSGMLVRLAFSVMVQVDADVLLIDEVLAVGDAAFQQKCYDEFNRIREQGKTVLLASTLDLKQQTGSYAAGDEIEFRISFENLFSPERYFATPAIARGGDMIAWIDRRERHASAVVTGTRDTDAVVDLPVAIEIDRESVRA